MHNWEFLQVKILLVSTVHVENATGVSAMTRTLRDGLRARGHEVTVVERASCDLWTRIWTRVAGMPLKFFGPVVLLWREHWKYYFQVRNGCQRNTKKYDIIHAQDLGSAAAARRVFPEVPVLTTCHFNDHPVPEMLRQKNCEDRDAGILWKLFDRLFGETLNYHCVSHYVAKKIKPHLPEAANVTVIHNGINQESFHQARESAELIKLAAGRKVILNVGTVETRKNQRLFLEIVPFLPEDVVVCLIGNGSDLPNLKRDAREKGMEERFIFAGERRDVAEWMKAADLYFHAAHNENCPVTLLESMACGLPTLAFAVGGIPELLDMEEGSLLDPESSAEDIAGKIHSLLSDQHQRTTLATRQQQRMRSDFTETKMLEELEKIYHNLTTN